VSTIYPLIIQVAEYSCGQSIGVSVCFGDAEFYANDSDLVSNRADWAELSPYDILVSLSDL
jgi:hypothetical protein